MNDKYLPPERQEAVRRFKQRQELFRKLIDVWNDFKLEPPITLADKTQAAITFAALVVATWHVTHQRNLEYVMSKEDLSNAVSMFRQELRLVADSKMDDVRRSTTLH